MIYSEIDIVELRRKEQLRHYSSQSVEQFRLGFEFLFLASLFLLCEVKNSTMLFLYRHFPFPFRKVFGWRIEP